MKKILVLEDEANIRSFVVINLNRAGYETIEAGSGEEALEQLRLNPDVGVALLDIMLPDMDGFEVCRRIRAGNSKIGIIMLTARTQEMDKVTGFMTGADDYVTKPFSPAELTARVGRPLPPHRRGCDASRRRRRSASPPFLLNTRNRTLEKNGQRIKLTQVEYAIIKLFMENPGKALAREEILHMVWGEGYLGELKIVDVNIRRLRVKIEDEPTSPTFITTVWGYGYKWRKCRSAWKNSKPAVSCLLTRLAPPARLVPGARFPSHRQSGIRQRWLMNSVSFLDHGPGGGRHRLWPHRQKLLRQQHPLRHGEQGPHRRQLFQQHQQQLQQRRRRLSLRRPGLRQFLPGRHPPGAAIPGPGVGPSSIPPTA
ncbi:MAG: response regulator transcription factor [Evtepia sp.]